MRTRIYFSSSLWLRSLPLSIAAALAGCAASDASPTTAVSAKHPLLGVHAPSFSRPAVVNSGSLSTERAKGKVVIVDFWATYCIPCEKEFPKLQALSERYHGDLLVYGLSEDDSLEGISAFVKKTGVRFPIGWDEGNAIGQRYKLEKMPTSYIVDRRGVVRFVHGGYGDGVEDQIAREIDQLLR
jgi:cytochrome c biogenesis protein CcmG/thiol:disulfide interchange protein DsbE